VKALSLTQPWASLVALGHKRVETRSWPTRYRGLLAIHASKGFPGWAQDFAAEERAPGRVPARLPLGAVLCVVQLCSVVPTEEAEGRVSGLERHLGDYSPGRYAWMLRLVEVFDEPVPARGSLGLWDWDRPQPGAVVARG
jgi:hypothetical protein